MLWIILSLVFIGNISYSIAQQQSPQGTNTVEKEQIASADPRQATKNIPSSPPKLKVVAQSVISAPSSPVDASQTKCPEKKPDENWVDKIRTDPVATFTGLLFFATFALWWSTRSLVLGAEETSRKELRAYVATDDIFFDSYESISPLSARFGGPSTITKHTNQLKIAIKNYGRTPAHRLTIRCECSFNIHDLRYKHGITELLEAEQMLHPSQCLNFSIPTVGEFQAITSRFYVIGNIHYCDIYNQWWVTEFCYRYEGDGRFTPYGNQNCESGPFKQSPDQCDAQLTQYGNLSLKTEPPNLI